MVDHQPSIFPFGIRIDEPMATATDVLVSAVCLYAFINLTKKNLPSRAQLYMRYYFLMLSVGTLLGGIIGHGFLYALSLPWKLPGWIISLLSVILIERSAISHARPLIDQKVGKFFLAFNVVEFFVVAALTLITVDFKWVEFQSGFGLLVIVGGFHTLTYYRTKDKGSLIILCSIVVTIISGLVFSFKLSLHTWFNYLDISHTLLAVAAYVMYLGAIRLKSGSTGITQ
ncbi:MAG: hypothetical protein ABI477_09735 [Chryseolinea sp.]